MAERPPLVLVASGLDPSGGAGFTLDLWTLGQLGAVGCGVVTTLTVQDSRGARRSEPVPEDIIAEQLAAVLSDIAVSAVKIGLVPSGAVARALAAALAQTAAPIVWDPVFAASSGAALLHDDPRDIAAALAPECALITPNAGEAAILGGGPSELAARFGCAVLVTGGHLEGPSATDSLADHDGRRDYAAPRVPGSSPRGTGCFLSAAIAARLAHGDPLRDAIAAAKSALSARLSAPNSRGRGAPVLF